jgi:hypothetical protein
MEIGGGMGASGGFGEGWSGKNVWTYSVTYQLQCASLRPRILFLGSL